MFAMFRQKKSMVAAALLGVALVSGCGAASPQVKGSGQVPQEVLRDPVARLQTMQWMRIQILRKTMHLEQERYLGVVRPDLAGQLVRAGFTAPEAEQVLAWVDEARADRARTARWWSSLVGGEPPQHSMR
jgi:hypothetical protein